MEIPYFTHHKLRASIASNTLAQILGKLITSGSVFLVTLVIARKFGAFGYGEFSKITTYIPMFFLFSDFGLNALYLQKEAVSHRSVWHILLATRVIMSLLLTAFALLLVTVLPVGATQGYTPLVRIGIVINAASIFFQAMISTGNALFQKHLRYDLSTIAVALGSIVLLGYLSLPSSLMGTAQSGILLSILFFVLSAATTAVATLLLARRFTDSLTPLFDWPAIKKLVIQATPLGLTLTANLIYFRVDSIVLTVFRSTEEVGLYSFAYKLFELPLVIPIFFMNSVYPLLLAAHITRGYTRSAITIIRKSGLVLFFSALVISLGLWFSAPLLSFVQEEFVRAQPYLRILSLGLPFYFLSNLTMWVMITYKKHRQLLILYSSFMFLVVILSLVFIPNYGAFAAAWITVVAEALLLVVSFVYIKVRIPLSEQLS